MKPIYLLLAIGFLTISCDSRYDGPTDELETLPVSQVEMPIKFAKDSITEIPVHYIRPSVCHFFYDFYYVRNNFTRTVAIIALKQNSGSNCPPSQLDYTANIRFKPASLGTYHFKFWTGTNAQGVDQFAEYDAVVDH